MLLELGRLRASVVSAPFSVGEDGYEDGKLAASSDSHDSLEEDKQFETDQGAEAKLQGGQVNTSQRLTQSMSTRDRGQKKCRLY